MATPAPFLRLGARLAAALSGLLVGTAVVLTAPQTVEPAADDAARFADERNRRELLAGEVERGDHGGDGAGGRGDHLPEGRRSGSGRRGHGAWMELSHGSEMRSPSIATLSAYALAQL